jgi:uncharacterized protein (TIGR03435 family)
MTRAIIGCFVLMSTVTVAQTPPAFEVASVKPNKSGSALESISPTPGRFVATNATLRNLITVAYRIPWTRLVGESSVLSERFDIAAKMPDDAEPGQMGLMLQTLLAERFHLKAHSETREQPVYALVLARSDGQLGPELRLSESDCTPTRLERPACGWSNGPSTLKANGVPMTALANSLSGIVDRIVIDRTNLTGTYDLDLQFARFDVPGSELPSIFTALQQQLGLKLESTESPIEFVVIDDIERPTPD